MSTMKQFLIEFTNIQQAYYPGQALSGQVVLKIEEPLPVRLVRAFQGKAYVYWKERRSSGVGDTSLLWPSNHLVGWRTGILGQRESSPSRIAYISISVHFVWCTIIIGDKLWWVHSLLGCCSCGVIYSYNQVQNGIHSQSILISMMPDCWHPWGVTLTRHYVVYAVSQDHWLCMPALIEWDIAPENQSAYQLPLKIWQDRS